MLALSFLVGAAVVAAAKGPGDQCPGKKCAATGTFENLVTFGDSYTDNGRLGYYINNNGTAPPAGQLHKESNKTASGGLTWAQFVASDTGAKLYDYAVSGATCSNNIISRYFSAIKRSFPAVLEDEIPSFQADVSSQTLYPDRTADNTLYAVWIGTNDLGFGAFLSDQQAPGKTITDYVNCVWSVFDAIYKTGGRRFVLLNNVPLGLAPLYSEPQNGGTLDSQFWGNKTLYNVTEYSFKIKQYSTTANALFDFGTAFQVKLKNRWPGAIVDIFDVHSLITDIVKTPQQFLDAPFNTTGYFRHCQAANNQVCTDLTTVGPKSGFLWYDELHPSEKTGRFQGSGQLTAWKDCC